MLNNCFNVKIKTGETYCQTCDASVSTWMDTENMFNHNTKERYWETSFYCTLCGTQIYTITTHQGFDK